MANPKKKEIQRKLTREEKKKLNALIQRNSEKGKKPYSTQATIPYLRMWPDGVCQVTENHFTKTIQFQDINYQLAQNEDKTAIFEGWCDFLNYFDASIQFQFSFLNLAANAETFEQSVMIPYKEDGFDNIREEYADMLHNQLAKGNNGLTKTKFITFGIDADSIRTAKPRLERVEIDLLNNFKRLGVAAEVLDGKTRLQLLHGIFHMDTQDKFMFEWQWLPLTGLSTKDFIAPGSFDFSDSRSYRMGEKYATTSFLQIMAPELNDRMLADFLAMDSSLIATMHIHSIDQTEAIKTIKRKITDLDKSKIDEQKKAVRAGYDIDIIPSDLATYGSEAKKLLEDLQSRNERMFLLTFLLIDTYNTGENRGREVSHSLNYQKLGKSLMSMDELAVMDGSMCILQLRGVRPFFSKKYDITQHPRYRELSDYDKKNTLDMGRFLSTNLKLRPDDEYDVIEINVSEEDLPPEEEEEDDSFDIEPLDEELLGDDEPLDLSTVF